MDDLRDTMLLAGADVGKGFIPCADCRVVGMATDGLQTDLSHEALPDGAVRSFFGGYKALEEMGDLMGYGSQ